VGAYIPKRVYDDGYYLFNSLMLWDVIFFNTVHTKLFINQIVLIYFSISSLLAHLIIWINTRRNKDNYNLIRILHVRWF